MPTYEYVCTECGGPLEVVQSIHDPALTDCPACGGRLRKVFGNVGVVFKGSGFYRTDSRGKSSAAAPAAKKSDASSDSPAAASGSPAPPAPPGSGSAAGSAATSSPKAPAASGS
jgi:putative FmdB family regulatory protein